MLMRNSIPVTHDLLKHCLLYLFFSEERFFNFTQLFHWQCVSSRSSINHQFLLNSVRMMSWKVLRSSLTSLPNHWLHLTLNMFAFKIFSEAKWFKHKICSQNVVRTQKSYIPSSEARVRNLSDTKSCLSISRTTFHKLSNFLSAPISTDAIFNSKQAAQRASVTRGT